jgi:hypothetical protein
MNAKPVSRTDESVPKHERVINDFREEISKLIGNQKEGTENRKRSEKE